ncbi:MAG: ferrous iron transport protein B [Oscillospiraceae bacterium]|nr:ferrous iron transport protein B [Oscillospiraceae bacterium]
MKDEIILSGNPNVGKSTIFNSLTGLKQHTGNWSGKTVELAYGVRIHKDKEYKITDLPGTYSLMARSREEEIARDYIEQNKDACIIVICDASCLERNLNLVLQILEIAPRVIVCVNFMDEAKRKGININFLRLSELLGVPVILTTARKKKGLGDLLDAVYEMTSRTVTADPPPHKIVTEDPNVQKMLEKAKKRFSENETYNQINAEEYDDILVSVFVSAAEKIHAECVSFEDISKLCDRKIDRFLTNKLTGFPVMILFFVLIFWLTITGSNYPSELLTGLFARFKTVLTDFLIFIKTPDWLCSLLINGVYSVLAWVVSVMLPPMAIFFPLFTLLEDLGYLPRIAFNLDRFFKKARACGKQALTMAMGFGCNACGVIGARIIDSPRERLIAIITNVFVPCNGRFPLLIIIMALFFTGMAEGFMGTALPALILTAVIILGVAVTLLISRLLSATILKGMPSSFTLELPPYRRPQIVKVLIRSILDRTLFVLGRAVIVAAPAGLVIWVLANVHVGAESNSLLYVISGALDPFGRALGMDGVIILGFILGFPANEIVLPIIMMCYLSTDTLIELTELSQINRLFIQNGWTWVTAVSVILFTLMHFPCSTTCLTILKETKSVKWTALSFLIPTVTGIVFCAGFNGGVLVFRAFANL